MNFSITRNGNPLDPSLYHWDEETKILSTREEDLALDFSGINSVTFKTGCFCAFKTSRSCTFNTGYSCTFNTGSNCTFNTGQHCTFDVGSGCTFKTGEECVIVRRDHYEVIEIPENVGIKLNAGVKGYTIVEPEREIIEIAGQRYYRDEVEERLKELEPVRYSGIFLENETKETP